MQVIFIWKRQFKKSIFTFKDMDILVILVVKLIPITILHVGWYMGYPIPTTG